MLPVFNLHYEEMLMNVLGKLQSVDLEHSYSLYSSI